MGNKRSGQNSDSIKGAILAAGKGSRMHKLPSPLPKSLLPILGKPIIYYQLKTMAHLGIREVYIVLGRHGFIEKELEGLYPGLGLSIHYVYDDQALGIAHSTSLLESRINGPFMLFLGDIFFQAPRITEMLSLFKRPGVDGVLAAVYESDEKEQAETAH